MRKRCLNRSSLSRFFIHMPHFDNDFCCFFIAEKLLAEQSYIAVLLVFFVSSSDALVSFYICSHSKAEKVEFSELLLLTLTEFARVTSFLTRFSKSF